MTDVGLTALGCVALWYPTGCQAGAVFTEGGVAHWAGLPRPAMLDLTESRDSLKGKEKNKGNSLIEPIGLNTANH